MCVTKTLLFRLIQFKGEVDSSQLCCGSCILTPLLLDVLFLFSSYPTFSGH